MESDPLVVKNGFGTSCLLFWQILIENGGVYAEFVTKTHWCCLIMSINSMTIPQMVKKWYLGMPWEMVKK